MKINQKKIYCYILAAMPILSRYGIPALPMITLPDYLLLLFCLVECGLIIFRHKRISVNKTFLPVAIWIVLQPLILMLYQSGTVDYLDALGTAYRLAWFYMILTMFSRCCADQKYLSKGIRFVGVTSSIYGIIQYILGNFAHYSLTPYLPFLPVVRLGLDKQQLEWIAYGFTVRARAWFSEPSMFAIYLLLALTIELFITAPTKATAKYGVLYSVAIFLSASSTGIIGLAVVMGIYLYRLLQSRQKKNLKKLMVASYVILPLAFFLLIKTGILGEFIHHTFAGGKGLAAQSHFVGVEDAFQAQRGIYGILFGSGMQEIGEGIYLPGWFRLYYTLGAVGLALFLWMFYRLFKQVSKMQKIIILLFFVLNIGTEVMMGPLCLLYFSVATMHIEESVPTIKEKSTHHVKEILYE